ncbi:DUF5455 family protein [Chitinivorax sp. B]|uniref:DUF5455 family protein n=1 Tax=Chitinivorax sp. B TaxID=2502235 RepID=UPI0010F466B6|nr:DUF5455 family protein [Chitinivorax sp. B]
MPAFLMGLFGGLATWLGQWLTKKTAIGVAAVAAFTSMTVTMWSVCMGAIAALKYSLPDPVMAVAGQVLPSNLPACVAAYIAARMARAFYDWNVETLKIMSYVT